MSAPWVALGLAAALGLELAPGPAGAHEERMLVGRVERLDPTRGELVVTDRAGAERRRLEVNAETEVLACGAPGPLAGLRVGELVRVKYADRVGAAPAARSVLVLGASR